MIKKVYSLVVLLCVVVLLAACAAPATVAPTAVPTASGPRVFFVEPKDGATVSSPVKIKMGAEGIALAPAADGIKAGTGHLHIIVNADCVAVGQTIPSNETNLHYGKAQTEAELTLAPGKYKLCLQIADAVHSALPGAGMTQVINIEVK